MSKAIEDAMSEVKIIIMSMRIPPRFLYCLLGPRYFYFANGVPKLKNFVKLSASMLISLRISASYKLWTGEFDRIDEEIACLTFTHSVYTPGQPKQ